MKEINFFDFTKEPGKILRKREKVGNITHLVSIITASYNAKEFIFQTANSILNQTFPFWEWIIVDDGSKDENSKKRLEEIQKLDERIKVIFNKENKGAPATRDDGINKAVADYVFILDDDDLLDPTALETSYFAAYTHPKVSWVYGDSVGFGYHEYLWNQKFDTLKEKKMNLLTCTALIKKKDIQEVGGFSASPNKSHEDWQLWINLLKKGKKPLRMSYYTSWYRKQHTGRLSTLSADKKGNKIATNNVIKSAKSINKRVGAIQYPNSSNFKPYSSHPYEFDLNLPVLNPIKNGKRILFMFPWMTLGGADRFNINLLEKLYEQGYDITVVTTEVSTYVWRQEFEKYTSDIFDLTSFLDKEDWPAFISYLIKSRNIDLVFESNSLYGYYLIPWLKLKFHDIPFIDYIHMEEWHWRDGGFPRDSIAVEKYLDHTYTCSKYLIDIMFEKMNKQKNDIDVVYIGTDEKKFNPDEVKPSKDKLLEKIANKKKVIFPCRIAEQKRPYLMVEILNKLVKKRKDIAFVVVGDGNLLDGVKQKVNEYEISDNIVFIPAKNDIREYYKIADATLICSMIEGLSLTAYESLAMNVPVITADVGGQKELVDNTCGRTIKLFQDPNKDINNYKYSNEEIDSYVKAIIEVVDDKDIRNNCRKRILDGFTVSQMQDKMLNIIENTIKEGTKIKLEDIKYDYNLAERYLVLFNELDRKYYFNPDNSHVSGSKLVNKLWQHKWYRTMIKFFQKSGVTAFVKKIRGRR